MSFLIMAQAMKIKTGSASRKIILLRLADQANDDGVCFPSINSLASYTELSPRAVQKNIRELEEMGMIKRHDRHDPNGRTTSNYYTLTLDGHEEITHVKRAKKQGARNAGVHQMQGEGASDSSSEGAPNAPSYMKLSDTNLSTNLSIITQPQNQQLAQVPKTKYDHLKPFDVPPQTWFDYVQQRKTKRAEITSTSIKRLANEAEKAGITIAEAMEVCCEMGWSGFKADWYQNKTGGANQRQVPDLDFNSKGWLERARQNDPLGQFDDMERRLSGNTRGALK